jgi:Astacin (Peptidase family M12A)
MLKHVLVRLCACALALTTVSAQAPPRNDPHLPRVQVMPSADDFVVIDDMLLYPEQLNPAADLRQRTQAHIIDYRQRFGTWDGGVIPYQLADAFSDAERQRILGAFEQWSRIAPLLFVARTTQSGYLSVTKDPAQENQASPCFSNVGQFRRGGVVRTNLGGSCASSVRTIAHELGHAIGLWHEHQRSDRDQYLTIDIDNVRENARGNFNIVNGLPLIGEYDFGSVMHYPRSAFAVDTSRPTIVPHAPFESWTQRMGTLPDISERDHGAVSFLYTAQLRESTVRLPTESVRTRFDRADLLLAMERLHALYMSRSGLHRPQGLSIGDRPDYLGIAQWIFDLYLPARSGGFSTEGAFDIVIAAITRSDEWRQKNPGRTPLTPASFTRYVSFSRDEFLDVLTRLDGYYRAPDGLQRPDGLSIGGGPDFLGIAAWVFDVYLNERLRGTSPNAAWQVLENSIRATDEWRSKH